MLLVSVDAEYHGPCPIGTGCDDYPLLAGIVRAVSRCFNGKFDAFPGQRAESFRASGRQVELLARSEEAASSTFGVVKIEALQILITLSPNHCGMAFYPDSPPDIIASGRERVERNRSGSKSSYLTESSSIHVIV